MTFFPAATGAGDPVTGLNNFTRNATSSNPSYSFDIKNDYYLSDKQRLSVRYSRLYGQSVGANIYKNPADPTNAHSDNSVHNGVVEHNWTLSPSLFWTNRIGIERTIGTNHSPKFD